MSTATYAVAVDAGTRNHLEAEHLAHRLDTLLPSGVPGYLASSHVVSSGVNGGGAHTAVVASWPAGEETMPEREWLLSELDTVLDSEFGEAGDHETGLLVADLRVPEPPASSGPAALVEGAQDALVQHLDRSAGRLIRFPGREQIERPCTVAEVIEGSAVDAVEALAGTETGPATELDLSEWARPTWRDGRVVLLVQPGNGALVPFETRNQIACCSDH